MYRSHCYEYNKNMTLTVLTLSNCEIMNMYVFIEILTKIALKIRTNTTLIVFGTIEYYYS